MSLAHTGFDSCNSVEARASLPEAQHFACSCFVFFLFSFSWLGCPSHSSSASWTTTGTWLSLRSSGASSRLSLWACMRSCAYRRWEVATASFACNSGFVSSCASSDPDGFLRIEVCVPDGECLGSRSWLEKNADYKLHVTLGRECDFEPEVELRHAFLLLCTACIRVHVLYVLDAVWIKLRASLHGKHGVLWGRWCTLSHRHLRCEFPCVS
jgi:hypothetical protein